MRPTPRRWRSGNTTKAGTDIEALAYRDAQAEDDPNQDPYAPRRTSGGLLGIEKLPTNQGVLVGSYASVARMLDELATVPGVQVVMPDLSMTLLSAWRQEFGTRILPLMQCRREVRQAA